MWNSKELLKEAGLKSNDPLLSVLEDLFGRANPPGAFGGVLGLNGRPWAQAAGDNLHGFVHGALRNGMEMAGEMDQRRKKKDPETRRAGALYLYNDRADELVMAASEGFPLQADVVQTDGNGSKRSIYLLSGELGAQGDQVPLPLDRVPSTRRGILRLNHLSEKVAPFLQKTSIARSDWVTGELRASCNIKEQLPTDFDCNRILVGIAFYKTGGAGITAQLFNRQEGPQLERGFLATAPGGMADVDAGEMYRNCVEQEFDNGPWTGFRKRFSSHLQEHQLEERTLVFQRRSDMGAGRKDTAGVYEGLQFPAADCIGPFLGTVLRFNGEHLGILKVERWYLPWSGPGHPREKLPVTFSASATARFLVFAYVLAGALYVLKHHYGVNLSNAWRGCDCNGQVKP
jgi:hypothetical protein